MIFNLKFAKKDKEILVLELIFILACFFRLAYFYQISSTPFFDPGNDQLDQSYYDQWASNIARGNFLGKEVFYGLPLYPYLLSFIYFWFGRNIDLVKFIQLIAGAVNCLLIYFIARKVFNKTVAVISAVVASAYGVFLFYEEMLLSSGLAIFLTNSALLIFLYLLKNPSNKKFMLSGIVFALSCLSQSSNFLFIIFILFWIGVIFKEKRKVFFYCLYFLLGLILLIAPITLRNYLVGKDTVLVTYHSGINFYAGNNRTSEGIFNLPPEIRPSIKGMQEDSRNIAQKTLGRYLKPSEISHFWFKEGVKSIKRHPRVAFNSFFKKIYFFWNGYEISDIHNFYFVRGSAAILKAAFFNFYLIGALGLLGIVLSLKRKESLLLIMFIVSTMLALALFFVTSRYRLIAVGPLIIFASYTFYWLVKQMEDKNYKILTKSSLILGAFFVLLNFKLLDQGFINEYFYLGNYYLKVNRLEEAELHYKKVLGLDAGYVDAYYNLGVVAYKKGGMDSAIGYFKKALVIKPDYADVHYNLGLAYEEKSLWDYAQEEYKKAVEINVYDTDARYNLANIYNRQGKIEEAIKLYEEILSMKPALLEAHNALGKAYQKKGLLAKAKQEFIIALKIDPLYAPARINLYILEKELR